MFLFLLACNPFVNVNTNVLSYVLGTALAPQYTPFKKVMAVVLVVLASFSSTALNVNVLFVVIF
ncbi:hypothetical protein CWE04_11955 [Thomasclavelia cocleata]|nr:hypothetical protein CWE04_11955 [Thomasclavelia cocleata]